MRAVDALVNLLYPLNLRCEGCGKEAIVNNGFCEACGSKLPRLGKPDARAIAPFYYNEPINTLIKRLKYENGRYIAAYLGAFMAEALQASGYVPDLLVPVPLHEKRLRERGYNQSLLLAREVSKRTGVAVAEILTRTRNTASQTEMDAEARRKNVLGVFCAKEGNYDFQKILLVDDVLTTGETAKECALALTKAKKSEVRVLVCAISGAIL